MPAWLGSNRFFNFLDLDFHYACIVSFRAKEADDLFIFIIMKVNGIDLQHSEEGRRDKAPVKSLLLRLIKAVYMLNPAHNLPYKPFDMENIIISIL